MKERTLSTHPNFDVVSVCLAGAKNRGRFPFDQKFWKFRVGKRMEQTFSGIYSEIVSVPREVGLKK